MLKTLLRSVREYKRDSLLAPAFVACEGIAEVIIPLLMADLIDFGIELGDMAYIVKMGIALVISALMLAFNLFGNGLRDAFDPRMRGL